MIVNVVWSSTLYYGISQVMKPTRYLNHSFIAHLGAFNCQTCSDVHNCFKERSSDIGNLVRLNFLNQLGLVNYKYCSSYSEYNSSAVVSVLHPKYIIITLISRVTKAINLVITLINYCSGSEEPSRLIRKNQILIYHFESDKTESDY
jgi:hypothetical protein